jgi:hypothetical protein
MSFLGLATGADLRGAQEDLEQKLADARDLLSALDGALQKAEEHILVAPASSLKDTHLCTASQQQPFAQFGRITVCVRKEDAGSTFYTTPPPADRWCAPKLSYNSGVFREDYVCSNSGRNVAFLAPAFTGLSIQASVAHRSLSAEICPDGELSVGGECVADPTSLPI